jgi:hypothetical protein
MELRVGVLQGPSQWEWQNVSLAKNTAIARRNTRASNRENNQATFQLYG